MANKLQENTSKKRKSPHGSTEKHEHLVKLILVAVSSSGRAKVWANHTGMAYRRGRPIFFGLKGSADILGITCEGLFLAIEVKTGNSQQSSQQRNFEKMVKDNNGIYILARSVEDVMICLNP